MLHRWTYPALVQQRPEFPLFHDNTVSVEVYEIDASVRPALDAIEGHPSLFERRVISTGGFGDIWVYFMDTETTLVGRTRVITDNKWTGEETPYTWVDFSNGQCKPKIEYGQRHMTKDVRGKDIEKAVFSIRAPTPGTDDILYEKGDKHWDYNLGCFIDEYGVKYDRITGTGTYVRRVDQGPRPPMIVVPDKVVTAIAAPADPHTIQIPNGGKALEAVNPKILTL
jgi:gamma-glutamylcyclotransferase (GGCT)/AIG2-like uncharacterized protein YtfP